MNLDDLEPLPEDMSLLLRQGRPGAEPPAGAREAVLSFVAAHGVLASATAAAHGTSADMMRMAGVKAWGAIKRSFGVGGIVLGAAVGAGGHAAYVASHEVRAAGAPVSVASVAPIVSVALQESIPTIDLEAIPSVPVPPAAATLRGASADHGNAKSGKESSVSVEGSLIDTARTAVARRDGEAALAMLQRHANDFPDGPLAEEREWLTIQALGLLGRSDDARDRATAFRRRFPHSLMLPALDQVVGSGTARP